MRMPNVEDQLALHRLVALYGHVIDEQDFGRASDLFTDEAIYDLSEMGGPTLRGWRAIAAHWSRPDIRHPLAHHATNVVVDDHDGEVGVIFKGLGVGYRGRVGSLVYRTKAVKTPAGWRFSHITPSLRQIGKVRA
jgi:hypothetical protein